MHASVKLRPVDDTPKFKKDNGVLAELSGMP